MNDRLKFRAWDLDKKEYNQVGFLCSTMNENGIIEINCLKTNEGGYYYKNFVIEQCTGLKDKNGKLIFEGDIIKAFRQIEPPMIDLRKLENIPDDERFIFRIDYKKDSCCYIFTILKKFSDGDIDCYPRNIIPYYEVDELNKDSIQVIGNIHQDSHLLEGK